MEKEKYKIGKIALPAEFEPRKIMEKPVILVVSITGALFCLCSIILFLVFKGDAPFFSYLKNFLGINLEFFAYLETISFEAFIICEMCIISIIYYCKYNYDSFLQTYPVIDNRNSLEALKTVFQTTTHFTIFLILIYVLSLIIGIISLFNHGIIKGIVVVILFFLPFQIIEWCKISEEKIKNIKCKNESLENELDDLLRDIF